MFLCEMFFTGSFVYIYIRIVYMCLHMRLLEIHAYTCYWLDVEVRSCGTQVSIELKDLATFDKEKWIFIENLCFLIKKNTIKTDQINISGFMFILLHKA